MEMFRIDVAAWLFCSYTVSKLVHTLVIPKKHTPFGMQTHKSIRQMVIETGSNDSGGLAQATVQLSTWLLSS